jgi:hypothetical protein
MASIPKAQGGRFAYIILGLFTIFLALGFLVADRLSPAGRRIAKIAGVDPPAYFAVSHSMLFDHDFDLANEFQRFPSDDNPWTRVRPETGHPGSAYAIGYSILAMPFLALGTLADKLAGHPADGFSSFAIIGYCLANVVLSCLGLMATFRLLYRAGALWGVTGTRAAWYALFATGAIFFGTTVAYYSLSQISHASTFFCSSLFLACWWEIRESTDWRGWALLGLFGGLLALSRWQEMFFVFSPFVYDVLDRSFFSKFGPWLRTRLVYFAVVALCWIPQMMEWKFIYGKWLSNPYGSVLAFPPPWLPHVVFSSLNGWFFWTPLAMIGVGGLLFGLWKKGRVFLPGLVVICLEIFLIASVQRFWYGADTFGSRYLTSSAPLIGLGLVSILYAGNRLMRGLVATLAVACCLFSSLFAIQFRLDLIPRSETLTAGEAFGDKLHLMAARRRKAAILQAGDLLKQGSADAAVKTLVEAEQAYGKNRELLSELKNAYLADGRAAEAEETGRQLDALLETRMF